MDYKLQHEEFVSNLKGSSIWSLILHLLFIPTNILFFTICRGNYEPHLFFELFLFIYPITLSLTIFHNSIELILFCLLFITLCILYYQYSRNKFEFTSSSSSSSLLSIPSSSVPRNPIISLFKGANMLLTCISILAIDFQVFPRKFGKTEYYGISLMDIGAGTFVVCSALTSHYARRENNKIISTITFSQKLLIIWQKIIVLLLGIGRLFVIKILNYQEHTSEYGTHWNFFVTLFFLWLFSDLFHIICQYFKWKEEYILPILSLVCLLCYQYLLVSTSLTDYIFHHPRTSFLSHNREGIFSLFGYIPLYLLTEWYSRLTFFSSPNPPPSTFSSSESLTYSLKKIQWNDIWWTLASNEQFLFLLFGNFVILCCYHLSSLIQPPSRRLMNISFIGVVLLISLINLLYIFIIQFLFQYFFRYKNISCTMSSSLLPPTSIPKTLYLWNKNQLILFLLANILTGSINILFQTIFMSNISALVVILCYITVLVVVSWIIP